MQQTGTFRPKLWVAGDWNAFFGLFTNVVLNVLVLSGLSLGVVQIPSDTVFGRILPALGIALPIGNLFYAWLAWQLGKREGRNDVAAMPYGPSVPHMFIVVFVIMLPVYIQTKDAIKAWEAGLAWCFIIGLIILLGAFIGPTIRRYTPRAAMLGTLAGISIAFISMRAGFSSLEVPWIAFISLAIILVSWTANVRLPYGIPGGLAAVVIGTAVGWIGTLVFNAEAGLATKAVGDSLNLVGVHVPIPGTEVFTGLGDWLTLILATAIPLGVYNFIEGTNNVESAAAAGDRYNLRLVLLADGFGALIGSILGSPFPPAVYIGHPGWKAVGGRIGYSLATGIVVAIVCFMGLAGFLLAVIPIQALYPILLFIGLVIGAQAFQTSPRRHAPAIVLALLPNIALWAQGLVDDALQAANSSAAAINYDKLNSTDLYHGMSLLGGGAVLAGLVLGAIAVFVIDREFNRAIVYTGIGAILAFVGLINSPHFFLQNTNGSWTLSIDNWGVIIGYVFAMIVFAVVAISEGQLKSLSDLVKALTTPPTQDAVEPAETIESIA
jgi:AGZA family xanthine/uracil permease-like MFS transporter